MTEEPPYIKDLIGTKFTVHGRTKEEGFDCWGYGIEYFRRLGKTLIDVPYNTLDEREVIRQDLLLKQSVKKIDKAEINCIIEIQDKGLPSHIGMYLGEGQFTHATTRFGVIIEPISRYSKKIVGFYKV